MLRNDVMSDKDLLEMQINFLPKLQLQRRFMSKTISVQRIEGIISFWTKCSRTMRTGMRNANLDSDTPAQGSTFAPGDLLPTINKK